MANPKFLGIKQVTLNGTSGYNSYSDEEKKGYLWIVRDISGSTVLSSAIYFGTRKYAETNDGTASTLASNLKTAMGGLLDENGEYVGFPFGGSETAEDHPILSEDADSLVDILKNLEAAIIANQNSIKTNEDAIADINSALTDYVDVTTFNNTIAGLESAITSNEVIEEMQDDIDTLKESVSALTDELDTKANAADVYTKSEVYTKDEVDGKISGVWHFKGTVDAIENLPTDAENGDVYQVGEKEYAFNGTSWVELGFNVDLSTYATKEYAEGLTNDLKSEVNVELSGISEDINTLSNEVNDLNDKATVSAKTLDDAEALAKAENLGQIIYITDTVEGESGYTAGAYVVTGEGTVARLGTTSSTGDLDDAVATLETKVTALENDKHTTIEGDDVEE